MKRLASSVIPRLLLLKKQRNSIPIHMPPPITAIARFATCSTKPLSITAISATNSILARFPNRFQPHSPLSGVGAKPTPFLYGQKKRPRLLKNNSEGRRVLLEKNYFRHYLEEVYDFFSAITCSAAMRPNTAAFENAVPVMYAAPCKPPVISPAA